MRRKWWWIAPMALIGIAVFVALGGLIVRELWNWLLPSLFGFPRIRFWQALGLLALCRILFGGLGLHSSGRSHFRRRMAERWEERWGQMTPEQRERLRQRFGHWGASAAPGETRES
jgi:hypothetical protein